MREGLGMDKTTYTFTCGTCKKEFPIACYGLLQPLARPLAEIWSFSHIAIMHRAVLGWMTWLKVLGKLVKSMIKLLLLSVFTVIRAASFVFYPVYILLEVLYHM